MRPTVTASGKAVLEVHLFDFSGELYGRTLDVAFIGWIRAELRFEGIEELIRHMDDDSRLARAVLARAGDAFPPIEACSPDGARNA